MRGFTFSMPYFSKKTSLLYPRAWIYLTLLPLCGLLIVRPVQAAEPKVTIKDSAFAAKFISQSLPDPIVMAQGETKSITLKFKNTGTATWDGSGKRFVSAYTMEPRDRESVFRGKTWKSARQTGKIAGTVKPGQTADLLIDFVASQKIGEYTERFYLASENHTWASGGYFFIKIKVIKKAADSTTNKSEASVDSGQPVGIATTSSISHRANRFILNTKSVAAVGGEAVKLIVGFQNVGASSWKRYALAPRQGATALAFASASFADQGWASRALVLARENEILPNGIVREEFYFRAPRSKGEYSADFRLTVDGAEVEGGNVSIPVTVTEDAPDHYTEPVFPGDAVITTPADEVPRLAQEPSIRVGLYKPESIVQFISYEDDYTVLKGEEVVGILEKNKVGFVSYNDGVYSFRGGGMEFSSSAYIRLTPVTSFHSIFTLLNFERLVSWKARSNFNAYRGAFELRLTKDGSVVYVINELLFEDYVAGIGENTNSAPEEYLKAQTVAQRTYAYYIKEDSTKHDSRNFDVVANTGDQLYLGYECEKIMPKFVAAASSTRGYMVTYNNNVVITPYFGVSSGRTKSWSEVWGGSDKPWLVSVPATYDKRDGVRKNGHGVGMAQRDAAIRADEEGLDWLALLKYYYSGVEARKIYP